MMVYIGKTREFVLQLGASKETEVMAKNLRSSMTQAEKILWEKLRNRQLLGLKFRRQHPLHYYVADFYCHEQRLVIEVDGGIHNNPDVFEHDQNRTAELKRLGIRVLRFTNEEILTDCQEVLNRITTFLNQPSE